MENMTTFPKKRMQTKGIWQEGARRSISIKYLYSESFRLYESNILCTSISSHKVTHTTSDLPDQIKSAYWLTV